MALREVGVPIAVLLWATSSCVHACPSMLLFGHTPTTSFNGVFDRSDTLESSGVASWVKRGSSPLYLWSFYGSYWVTTSEHESLNDLKCYALQGSESFPYEATTEWLCPDLDYPYVDPNIVVECLDESFEYMYRPGVCETDRMTELAVDGPSSHQDCQQICDASAACQGFSYYRDGCYPYSAACTETVMPDDYGFDFSRGILSTVALGRPAHQSSTLTEWPGAAELAVDGDVNGRLLGDFTCSHTLEEVQPWWIVSLDKVVSVTGVILANRADCCEFRLKQFTIRVGVTEDFAATVSNYAAKLFDGPECISIEENLALGERRQIQCIYNTLGNFVAIHGYNTVIPATLTLCEVEVLTTSVGRYWLSDTLTTRDKAQIICDERFGGLAHMGEDADVQAAAQYITDQGVWDVQGVWVDNIATDPYPADVDTWPLHNVAHWSYDASCTASSESAGGKICENALDDNQAMEWATNNEGVSAWFKVTFRYVYVLRKVRLLQRPDPDGQFKDVTLTFSDFSEQTMALRERLDSGERRFYDELVLTPVTSSFLKIEATTVYSTMDNGFAHVQVWANDPYGWAIQDGFCDDGHDISQTVSTMVECQNLCRSTAACQGFVYAVYGPEADFCYLRDQAECDSGQLFADPDSLTFSLTDTLGVSMRQGECHGNDYSWPLLSLGQAYTEMMNTPGAVAIGTCPYSNGGCPQYHVFIKSTSCTQISYYTYMVFFDLVTSPPVEVTYNPGHIGCFQDRSERDMSGDYNNAIVPMAVQDCIDFCAAGNWAYAAVESSWECFCDDSYGRYGRNGYCNIYCAGWGEACGGPWSMNVYSTQGSVDSDCYYLRDSIFSAVGTVPGDGGFMFDRAVCGGRELRFLCQRPYDACDDDPCLNSGTCSTVGDDFACDCVAGYTGVRCETEVDECGSIPCLNGGTCQDELNAYICLCPAGFTGTHCETDIDECASDPCQNAGTCDDPDPDSYICTCVPGFTGTHCETDINECESAPCRHGGTCDDQMNAFSCTCKAGYTGDQCQTELDECASGPCLNGGTCEDSIDWYYCFCGSGYTGTHCQTEILECLSTPCQNGGQCLEQVAGFQCACPSGFTGLLCQTNIDDCSSEPCNNHVQCVDLIEDYECQCLEGFTGKECQNYADNSGSWSSWSGWTECSVSCSTGVSLRTRECIPDQADGREAFCPGSASQSNSCSLPECDPVDGGWAGWTPDGPCSATCGPGFQTAVRYCSDPKPQLGGQECVGPSQKIIICENMPCPHFSLCEEWTTWSDCDGDCATASRNRTRSCDAPGDLLTVVVDEATYRIEASEERCTPEGCQAQELECAVCSGEFPDVASVINCQAAQTCGSEGDHCMTAYGFDSGLSLQKQCATKPECDEAVGTQSDPFCTRLLALTAAISFRVYLSDSVEDPSMDFSQTFMDELVSLWTRLNGSCTVCCQGNLCNSDILPPPELISHADNSVGSLHAGGGPWLALAALTVLASVELWRHTLTLINKCLATT